MARPTIEKTSFLLESAAITFFSEKRPDAGKPPEMILPDDDGASGSLLLSLSEDRLTAPLRFKLPEAESLAISASRMLRFEFPPDRDLKAHERLIKAHGLPSGSSRKALEALSLPEIERIHHALWCAGVGGDPGALDEWLTLFLLAEEMGEFYPEAMGRRDFELLESRTGGGVHGYYYREIPTGRHMAAFLEGHGYRSDFLLRESAAAGEALWRIYLICRRLSRPLPWSRLLLRLSPATVEKFPLLARLNAIRLLLEEAGWGGEAVTPGHLDETLEHLKALSEKSRVGLAKRYAVPRPVRIRVIVEGETEKKLLPIFAASQGLDFDALGVSLLPAGGKNHVIQLYRDNSRRLSIPVFVILDADADDIADDLRAMLRPGDGVFKIDEGEFEDLYDPELILKTINRTYSVYPELTADDLCQMEASAGAGRVRMLKRLWLTYQLGDFDKMAFAAQYAEVFCRESDGESGHVPLPAAIGRMLEAMMQLRNAAERHAF